MPKRTRLGKEVFGNSMYNFLATIISRGLGLVFIVVVARLLHPELFGIYSLALSIVFIFFTFTDLGVNLALVRYVSDAIGKKNKILARSYFQYLLKFKILFTSLFAIVLFILARVLSVSLFNKPLLIIPLEIGAVYLFFLSFLDFITGIFYSVKQVKYNALREGIFQVLRLIIAPVFILLFISQYKVFGVFLSMILASILSLITLLFIVNKKYGFFFHGKVIPIDTKRVMKYVLLLTITSLSAVFLTYIDTIMLGIFLPSQFVGFYRTALTIATSIAAFFTITVVMFPIFAQVDKKKLKEIFRKLFHFSAILAFPAAFGLIFIASPFIKSLFGPEYLPAVLPLYLLSFLIVEAGVFGYLVNLFQARERLKEPAIIIIISTIMNIILNYFFITFAIKISFEAGMIGAAAATIISRYSAVIAIAIMAKKRFKVAPTAESIYKPLFASIVMATALFFIQKITPPSNILEGIIQIAIAAFIYFSVLFIIKGIRKSDFQYIKSLVEK